MVQDPGEGFEKQIVARMESVVQGTSSEEPSCEEYFEFTRFNLYFDPITKRLEFQFEAQVTQPNHEVWYCGAAFFYRDTTNLSRVTYFTKFDANANNRTCQSSLSDGRKSISVPQEVIVFANIGVRKPDGSTIHCSKSQTITYG